MTRTKQLNTLHGIPKEIKGKKGGTPGMETKGEDFCRLEGTQVRSGIKKGMDDGNLESVGGKQKNEKEW